MKENPTRSCSRCGTLISDETAGGLCPRCLMAMNFDSRTMPEGEEPPHAPILTPEELAEKFPQYEILECLGRGGMGVVYKARQKSLDRIVAIKILPPERVGEERFSDRFAVEAATLAKLSHPNIVTVHDFGETGGLFYIVMEYVDGVNLRDLLRDGKLEPKQALAIVPPICDALQYAHDKGIVHRDIKPENLLLDRDGRIKIADFGIASLVGANGEIAGTPPYMAPEQKGTHIDHRADIYALGVVLYEMLTGERPDRDAVAPSKKVLLDVRIDEMVLRALEKEPERRYQTAGEFRTMVETVARAGAPAPDGSGREDARVEKPASQVETFERRRRALLWYGFITSVIGLPVGLALNLPVVWGLSIAGILIGGYRLRALGRVHALHNTAGEFRTVIETMQRPLPNPPPIPNSSPPQGMLRRWWWLFLVMIPLGLALGLAAGAGLNYVIPKKYEAQTTIEVRPPAGSQITPQFFGTQFEKLKSREALAEVAKRMELVKRWMLPEGEAIRVLKGIINVQNIRGTDLINIRVRHTNAWDATGIANDLIEIYQETSANKVLVHETAVVPKLPVSPNLTLNLVLTAFAGLIMSPLLALLAMVILQRLIPGQRPDARILAGTSTPLPGTAVFTAVAVALLLILTATGNAMAMMIGSGLVLTVGLIWFTKGNIRLGLLVALASLVAAGGVVLILNHRTTDRTSEARSITVDPSEMAITRVLADGNKVLIEGRVPANGRIAFHAGERGNGWSCAFPQDCRFTATLEKTSRGLKCRVQPEFGEPVLTMDRTNQIGDVKLADGELAFRAGQPVRDHNGVWVAGIGAWTSKGGTRVPICVSLMLLKPPATEKDAARLSQEGWQLWGSGKPAEARPKFEDTVKLAPDDANAWNGLGWSLFNSGNPIDAEKAFQKAVELDPKSPGGLNGLGQIYLSQRKYEEAEGFLLKAAEQRATAGMFGLARLYLLQGKFEQAEKWAQRVVDSGEADEVAKKMLEAAKAKNLPEGLRMKIEPPQPRGDANESSLGQPVATATPNDLTFGPVIERVLNEFESGHGDDAISFSTGQLFSIEDQIPGDVAMKTIDMLVSFTGGECKWLVNQMQFGDLENREWDQITRKRLEEALKAGTNRLEPLKNKGPWARLRWRSENSRMPIAFAFRKASGESGILQVTGFTEQPKGLKIRYKLVQSTTPKPPEAAAPEQTANGPNQRLSWLLEERPPLAEARPGLDAAPTFPLPADAVGWAESDGQLNPVMYLAKPVPRGGSEAPVDGALRNPGEPIRLNIYRGTNPLATANRFLGSYEITCQPPDAAIRAEFSLSPDGQLHLNVFPEKKGVIVGGSRLRPPDPPDKPSGIIRKMVVSPDRSNETPAFGPWIERVMNDPVDGKGQDMFIDVETNRLMNEATDVASKAATPREESKLMAAWLAANSIDFEAIHQREAWTRSEAEAFGKFFRETYGQTLPAGLLRGIESFDAAMVPLAIGKGEWDVLTPAALTSALTRTQALAVWFHPVGDDLPTTFVFKTREGSTGMLQVTGFTEQPKGLKIRYKLVQYPATPIAERAPPSNRNEQIAIEDLALHLIVAIREKDDAKLKSLASDRIKGWPEALPVFAVEMREHYRQMVGDEKFDLRAAESLVDGDLAAVKCTGPEKLKDVCLILFFVKTADGWRNHSLRNAPVGTPLAKHLADFKAEIEKKKPE